LIGAGATAILDLWSMCGARFFGVPPANWGTVGRWIGYFPRGRFVHANIADAAPVRGELLIGWTAHYAVGIFYAALLVAVEGVGWVHHPSLMPALILAWVALAAPFLIMQPGMGAGIAASRTPNPNVARLRSILGHTAFGVGLYVVALLTAFLFPAN
jgi:hypothetical protein